MNTVPNTYAEAQAQGISYKAWLYMCEQEEIEREQEEEANDEFFTALADPNSRQIFPSEDPDSICMCPACSAIRAKFEHDVALARAVLHCPEPATQSDPDWCHYCDRPRHDCACHLDPNGPPEETGLVNAALNTPIACWIQGQLAMERWIG